MEKVWHKQFPQEGTAARTAWQLSLGAFEKSRYQEYLFKDRAISTDTTTATPLLFSQNFKRPKFVNKTSEIILFFLIALMFAVASFIQIVLQAPPSLSLLKYELFLIQSKARDQLTRVSAGHRNEVQVTVMRSFVL